MKLGTTFASCPCLLAGLGSAGPIEPTWESLAADCHVPDWFVDGKLGVWFHWGIPSSIKDGRFTHEQSCSFRLRAQGSTSLEDRLNRVQ